MREDRIMRKRSTKVISPATTKGEFRYFRLELDTDLHGKLRVVAAEHGLTMKAFVLGIVERTVMDLYGRRDNH